MKRLLAAVLAIALPGCSGDGPASPTTAPAAPTSTTTSSTIAPTTTTRPGDWRLDELEAAAASYGTQGAIVVVLDGEDRWAGEYGVANQSGTPAEITMRFRAGSITKTVIATLAVLRAEDGNLDLDAPVDLAWLLSEPAVTTRQLLQHTAGIFDLGNEGDPIAALGAIPDPTIAAEALGLLELWEEGGPILTMPADFLVLAAETQPRYFPPGTGYHYSNPGYQVVAVVLEQVSSGLPAGMLVEQRLVLPHHLRLQSMSLAPWDDSSPELRGLEVTATGATDNTDDLFTFGNGGHGGLLTNADDLARFFRLLLSGEIVTADGVEEMIEPSEPSEVAGTPYGLGIATYNLSCGTFYGHGGSINGTVSLALADRTGGRVVVIAFNTRHINLDPGLVGLADTLLCG
jgi:D-alanyl-D-alanine carboxypeptidase